MSYHEISFLFEVPSMTMTMILIIIRKMSEKDKWIFMILSQHGHIYYVVWSTVVTTTDCTRLIRINA